MENFKDVERKVVYPTKGPLKDGYLWFCNNLLCNYFKKIKMCCLLFECSNYMTKKRCDTL